MDGSGDQEEIEGGVKIWRGIWRVVG